MVKKFVLLLIVIVATIPLASAGFWYDFWRATKLVLNQGICTVKCASVFCPVWENGKCTCNSLACHEEVIKTIKHLAS
ncbi:unnamed protein product [Cylicocyclus nassatus]|uniref:Uncharacterized protein n=1 Tax=Cylicocyclus nassatus TaxID=53992 RepID=A0AA36GCI8_CYLNA|nr:unnamed protein product [Cylicocyclus nassatus]